MCLYSESLFPVKLLRAARDSLTALTVSVRVIYGLVVDGLLETHLAATHFPQLEAVDLTIAEVVRPEQAENMLRFVKAHATQLLSLARCHSLECVVCVRPDSEMPMSGS